MNEDEIWETARKPVTEFVDAIKEMRSNVDELVKFYLKHASSMKSQSQLDPITTTQIKQEPHSTNTDKDNQNLMLSPLACAKLELAIVFAINTCYWLYLVTNGEDPSKSKISKDLERIRLFMNRAKEVDESLSETGPCTKRAKIDPRKEQW